MNQRKTVTCKHCGPTTTERVPYKVLCAKCGSTDIKITTRWDIDSLTEQDEADLAHAADWAAFKAQFAAR